MRLTIRHYFRTPSGEELVGAEAWDRIRETDSAFATPPTRSEWLRMSDRPELVRRAEMIARIAGERRANVVASYGVGPALRDRHLESRVGRLVCSDFTPRTIDRVTRYMPEADVRLHDLRSGPLDADLHVLHRVDTEFDNVELASTLDLFRGTEVLIVVSQFLNARYLLREIVTRVRGGHMAGWLRTEAAFQKVIPSGFETHRRQVADLPAFLLLREDSCD